MVRILDLPAELLEIIYDHLSPSEVASLALTCRHLYLHTDAEKPWTALKSRLIKRETCSNPPFYMASDEEERWNLLVLLGRDLKLTHTLCHFCRILHATGPPEMERCVWNRFTGPRWWNLGRLTFAEAREAMSEYRRLHAHANNKSERGSEILKLLFPSQEAGEPTRIPRLCISTDWKRHSCFGEGVLNRLDNNLSNPNNYNKPSEVVGSILEVRWRERYVKLDTEAVVPPCGDLIIRTTQRLWIPDSIPRPVEEQPPPTKISRLMGFFGWSRHYSPITEDPAGSFPPLADHGFQMCCHQKSYTASAQDRNLEQSPNHSHEWFNDSDYEHIFPQIEDVLDAHWRVLYQSPLENRHRKILAPQRYHPSRFHPYVFPFYRERTVSARKGITSWHNNDLQFYEQRQADSGRAQLTSVWRCHACPTNAQLNTLDHGHRGVEFILDTWQNLGGCRTPDSLCWSGCWKLYTVHCRPDGSGRPCEITGPPCSTTTNITDNNTPPKPPHILPCLHACGKCTTPNPQNPSHHDPVAPSNHFCPGLNCPITLPPKQSEPLTRAAMPDLHKALEHGLVGLVRDPDRRRNYLRWWEWRRGLPGLRDGREIWRERSGMFPALGVPGRSAIGDGSAGVERGM